MWKSHRADPIKPEISLRFEATAINQAELFLSYDKTVGPFEVIVTALSLKTRRQIFGTIQLSYASGAWVGEPVIENPVNGLGRPLDDFLTATLILGSDAYISTVSQFQNDVLNETRSTL